MKDIHLNKKYFISLIIFITILFNCKIKEEIKYWEGEIIKNPGKYYIDKNGYILEITDNGLLDYLNNNALINYKVYKKSNSEILISSKTHFSNFHRWGFYWDENDRLWIYSGDIGGVIIWVLNNVGKYQEIVLMDDIKDELTKYKWLIDKMPNQIFNFLPKSLQEHFKKLK